jgi:hypothetical protein
VIIAASLIDYIPILSTLVAGAFTVVLWRHWKRVPQARYLLWWTIGVAMYGLGTLTEAMTALIGWHEPLFRSWYIAGALLGGAPLAQGTVYLLMKKRHADRLTIAMIVYVAVASVFVLTTPLDPAAAEAGTLTGSVMEWQWVRAFSPLVNLYALVFLVGGAAWSAVRYSRLPERAPGRISGNWYIAVGALLPGIGGTFTRLGYVQVLYVMELLGLLLIWAGYRAISRSTTPSIHPIQRELATA